MIKNLSFFIITLILFESAISGQTVKISGKLLDFEDKRIIVNGVLILEPDKKSVITDPSGEYSFKCTPGRKRIFTRVMGYESAELKLNVTTDTVLDIQIKSSPYKLGEVRIVVDSAKSIVVTDRGSYFMTPIALSETPKLFSEPDLLKSIQFIPGVTPGRDGSSDIYVRGGNAGQNIVLTNGCYFFLPSHLLGFVSPYDIDFMESAELIKDYFSAELDGGAASVINLQYRKSKMDSLKTQLRIGILSSGISIDLPFKKINSGVTAGLKRSNYSLYAPILKMLSKTKNSIGSSLPPDNYCYYDGYLRFTHSSQKWGEISYVLLGNYDKSYQKTITESRSSDTLINNTDIISTGWNNMVHALEWKLPVTSSLKFELDLNYNRISIYRDISHQTELTINDSSNVNLFNTSFSFSPTINNYGFAFSVIKDGKKLSFITGISNRLRFFSPLIKASINDNGKETTNSFGGDNIISEPGIFFSLKTLLAKKLQTNVGLRLSGGFTQKVGYLIIEPRLRLAFNPDGFISPHINYVRLSQFDHYIEGSNVGLKSMLWIPISKKFSPEVSDVVSIGFQGKINDHFVWTLDAYYKKITGMVDFKSGASFIYDTSFDDMLDRINGKAYGLEAGIIKRIGKLTGSVNYTYSRSKREWGAPEGLIWIPTYADRPQNANISMKYYFKENLSFGFNWVYLSGAPATIYTNSSFFGDWFETKNNIRYFNYHRLDLSMRKVFLLKRFSVLLDIDIYNLYNRKNTYYFQQIYDTNKKRILYKNISLFPIMPSFILTIKF